MSNHGAIIENVQDTILVISLAVDDSLVALTTSFRKSSLSGRWLSSSHYNFFSASRKDCEQFSPVSYQWSQEKNV